MNREENESYIESLNLTYKPITEQIVLEASEYPPLLYDLFIKDLLPGSHCSKTISKSIMNLPIKDI